MRTRTQTSVSGCGFGSVDVVSELGRNRWAAEERLWWLEAWARAAEVASTALCRIKCNQD